MKFLIPFLLSLFCCLNLGGQAFTLIDPAFAAQQTAPAAAYQPLAPTLTSPSGDDINFRLINNDPGTPTLYKVYMSVNGTNGWTLDGYAAFYNDGNGSSSSTNCFNDSSDQYIAGTVVINGVESSFSNVILDEF